MKFILELVRVQVFFHCVTAETSHLVVVLLETHERVQVQPGRLPLFLVVDFIAVSIVERSSIVPQVILRDFFDISFDRRQKVQLWRALQIL